MALNKIVGVVTFTKVNFARYLVVIDIEKVPYTPRGPETILVNTKILPKPGGPLSREIIKQYEAQNGYIEHNGSGMVMFKIHIGRGKCAWDFIQDPHNNPYLYRKPISNIQRKGFPGSGSEVTRRCDGIIACVM